MALTNLPTESNDLSLYFVSKGHPLWQYIATYGPMTQLAWKLSPSICGVHAIPLARPHIYKWGSKNKGGCDIILYSCQLKAYYDKHP